MKPMQTYLFPFILRDALLNDGLSPQNLADQVGVTVTTVNKWLRGESYPNSVLLARIVLSIQSHRYELLESALYKKYERASDKYTDLKPFNLQESLGFMIGGVAASHSGIEKERFSELFAIFKNLNTYTPALHIEDRALAKNEPPNSELIILPQPKIIVINNWQSIVKKITEDHRELFNLSWKKFEDLMAHLLEKHGWEITPMGYTKDDGIDIFAVRRVAPKVEFTMMVQCKKYEQHRKVGVAIVKDVWATKWEKGIHHAMIATTSFFTKGAANKAEKWNLDLRDHDAIIELCQEYGNIVV